MNMLKLLQDHVSTDETLLITGDGFTAIIMPVRA